MRLTMCRVLSIALSILVASPLIRATFQHFPWTYKCDKFHRCVKDGILNEDIVSLMSFGECKLTCDKDSIVWPRPREFTMRQKTISRFHPNDINFVNEDLFVNSDMYSPLRAMIAEHIKSLGYKKRKDQVANPVGINFHIRLVATDFTTPTRITEETDESYELAVSYDSSRALLTANVSSVNYFGLRHGLETLFQLVEYDDVAGSYVILNDVRISDRPEFPHRGVILDTGRNFVELDTIQRLIDAMSMTKLNVLHWHLVDSQSSPMEYFRNPIFLITQYGAYDKTKVYKQERIKELVAYANFKGVRIIPEFDQPAHVAAGWDFKESENLTVCKDMQPWYDYCNEPPCGQLNPVNEQTYAILEQIYIELFDMFNFDDFHFGGTDISFKCWNSSSAVTSYMTQREDLSSLDEAAFLTLWGEFQENTSNALRNVISKKVGKILWSSRVTNGSTLDALPPDEYKIQFGGDASDTADPQLKTLFDKGYKIIFSNADAWRMDCGFGPWIEGNDKCNDYAGWPRVYENDPYKIAELHGVEMNEETKKQILGGEASLLGHQVDEESIDWKLFPRAAALAERLWSNPTEKWYKAERRILWQRLRNVRRGLAADVLQPEWCLYNGGQCYGRGQGSPIPSKSNNWWSSTSISEIAQRLEDESKAEKAESRKPHPYNAPLQQN